MLSVDMENKENGSVGVKNSLDNGRPPDPADWAVVDVVNYFRTAGFEEQANAFQEQVTVSRETHDEHNYPPFPQKQKEMRRERTRE
uniref:Sterile alpha motif domain containing 13 n=1 Tax=Myotis myotis TaxID=51298 RepID=A0A7J8A124_MYOMY|nr:sterile alpha motif domain containing 13 [Myotis myotis]